MRQIGLFILQAFITLSCAEKPKDKYDDLYVVLDELLRFKYYDDIVILELNKVQKYSVDMINLKDDTIKDRPLPPPPPGLIHYDREFLDGLCEDKLIDSVDIDYMLNQIDSLKDFTLDSSKIEKKTIRYSVLTPLFKKYSIDSAYSIIRQKFGAQSFIRISTPLFSKKGNKMLMDIDVYCGGLCGGGMTYLFEKRNGKWRITYSRSNWIS
jgi:hypothetical protein